MKFKSCFIFKATCIYIVKTHADNFAHFSKEMIHIETKKKKGKVCYHYNSLSKWEFCRKKYQIE